MAVPPARGVRSFADQQPSKTVVCRWGHGWLFLIGYTHQVSFAIPDSLWARISEWSRQTGAPISRLARAALEYVEMLAGKAAQWGERADETVQRQVADLQLTIQGAAGHQVRAIHEEAKYREEYLRQVRFADVGSRPMIRRYLETRAETEYLPLITELTDLTRILAPPPPPPEPDPPDAVRIREARYG